MANILVVANETLGGRKLLESVRRRSREGQHRFFLAVPQNRPRHGRVIYDEAVRDAAQVRVDLARQFMDAEGIKVEGEVGDPDPYTATMDAIALFGADEVIVVTITFDHEARRRSYELLAEAFGLSRLQSSAQCDARARSTA